MKCTCHYAWTREHLAKPGGRVVGQRALKEVLGVQARIVVCGGIRLLLDRCIDNFHAVRNVGVCLGLCWVVVNRNEIVIVKRA